MSDPIYQVMNELAVITELIQNSILLFALVFIFGASNMKPDSKEIIKKIILGLVIGSFAIMIMAFPWKLEEGLIFDSRSVLLSITGAFFSPLTSIIAMVAALVYRIILGGVGVYAGSLTIILTTLLGILWKLNHHRFRKVPHFIEYFFFGIIASLLTIICQLLLPWETASVTIPRLFAPFFLLFPFMSGVLGSAIINQIQRLNAQEEIRAQQVLLESSINSPKTMEIIVLDTKYQYMTFNDFHKDSMKKYYNVAIEKGKSYLSYIDNEEMYYRIKSYIDKALNGESFTRVVEVETTKGKYLEELYTPIRNDKHNIIGITIFSQDVTKRKEYEQNIVYLSFHDALTGLKNRRFYIEEIAKIDQPENQPITIVLADINGLKVMNDAFGHDAGDHLLKTVASEIQKHFQDKGVVARIGGDEFVILMKNTTKAQVVHWVEKAKEELEKNVIEGIHVSVAFGVETKIGNMTLEEVFKIAEDDMYKNKLFESSSNRNDAIKTIMNTLHVKNPREEYHSKRVSEYCQRIGSLLGMRKDELVLLKSIGNLHDIGKIAIDEAILNKPGKLTIEEWTEIKRHPEIGYRILSSSSEYAEFAEDILSHHERWDGKGYPQGLKGKEIPYRARIIAIADAYDAMTSSRPYRQGLSHEFAMEEIAKNAGTQFDPIIAKKFIESFEKKKAK